MKEMEMKILLLAFMSCMSNESRYPYYDSSLIWDAACNFNAL